MAEGKISALSVLAALFASTRKGPEVLVLYHFCALHSRQGDPSSGGRGLLQSLIAQLLIYLDRQCQGVAGLPITSNELLYDVARRDVLASCVLLGQLIAQVAQGVTIYCVLDNISEFETSIGNWNQEIQGVVSFLQQLVNEVTEGPVLKVLILAPMRSIQVDRQIPASDQIWLSSGNLLSNSVQQDAFTHDFQRAVFQQRNSEDLHTTNA